MSNDDAKALQDAVLQHAQNKSPLTIQGGGSKSFLGVAVDPDSASSTVSTLNHHGVINYDPTELVIPARSGTALTDIVKTLKASGQRLPFEPPMPANATLGGTLACGVSGPASPYAGAARDLMLGARIINGRGEDLSFGGEVMKNVAGYDVSRLQVGAFGTLGVVLDVSMKVLPLPESSVTLAFEQDEHDTAPMVELARQFLPITAAALIGRRRYLRLEGANAGVTASAKTLGGEEIAESDAPWEGLRDWTHPFFVTDTRTTWRLSVPDYAPKIDVPDDADGTPAAYLYDLGGAQRWLKTGLDAKTVFDLAKASGGHATRFSKGEIAAPSHQPIAGVAARLQTKLRQSFDPDGLFNPGRFHPELMA